jgi:pyridoxamine 5'-phosphate oxidase
MKSEPTKKMYDLRKSYEKNDFLLPENEEVNPFSLFSQWFAEAQNQHVVEPNAFTISTLDADGFAVSRTVLLKKMDEEGFYFFTNYLSNKALQLHQHPQAGLLFFWKEMERQVFMRCHVEKCSDALSDEYFAERPRGSRMGAWASFQGMEVENREELEKKQQFFEQFFLEKEIPRPSFWGGYRAIPICFEFWQGRKNRLHDRYLFQPKPNGGWAFRRLQP